MSQSISSSKPSYFLPSLGKHSSSNKPSSSLKRVSSKRSYFSSATVKPSFFGSGLEAFSKHSILRKNPGKNEILDLSQIDASIDGEEPGLENWDRWLKIHKHQQESLSGKLKRPPECMVMNTSWNTLPINQEKKMMAEASNITNFHQNKGHPIFWNSDDAMEKEEKQKVGVYQGIKQKYDRTQPNYYPKPQEFEYVGIPDEIYKEKGLIKEPCLPTPKQKWDGSVFVNKQKEKLKDKLDAILEHTPDLSEVVVVGKSIQKSNADSDVLSKPYISIMENYACSTDFEPAIKPSFLMTVVVAGEEVDKHSKFLTITFQNCFVNEMYDKSITICNSEKTTALKYCWNMILPQWARNDLPLRHVSKRSRCFYFDKNSSAILPGTEKKFVFYFKTSLAGIYSEKCELQISNSPDKFESMIIELHAVAVEKLDCVENLRVIDSYLESCTRYTIARKTVSSLIDRVRPERLEELPYDWKFFEEQIFVHNNPDFFYDSKCVSTLKTLFKKVSEGPWDLSIVSLREKLVQKSSEDSITEDLELFTNTVYKLMQPNKPSLLINEKHKTVYELLCSFANRMESESFNLKLIYNVPVKLRIPDEVEIDSLLYPRNSLTSGKVSAKASHVNKKSVKKLPSKTRPSIGKMSFTQEQTMNKIHSLSFTNSRDSSQDSTNSSFNAIRNKQEYLEAFYIKTYFFLSQTIDQVSAVIDSFDNSRAKTILNALKKTKSASTKEAYQLMKKP